MNSIVIELQQLAASGDESVTNLLRKAKVVSSKLGLAETSQWIKAELHGYNGEEIPDYRRVTGVPSVFNPFNGQVIPFLIADPDLQNTISVARAGQSIPSLESLLSSLDKSESSFAKFFYSEHQLEVFRNMKPANEDRYYGSQDWPDPFIRADMSQLHGVVERVRDIILDWALQLEAQGILGEGMSFSKEEKSRVASGHNISIEQFNGIIGDVTNSQLTVTGFESVQGRLQELGVPQENQDELHRIMQEYKSSTDAEARQGACSKALAWIGSNAEHVTSIAAALTKFFAN